jgi:hypothetical protein
MVPDTRDTYTIVSKQFLDFMKQRRYEPIDKTLFWAPRLCIKDTGVKVKFEMHPLLFDLHFLPTKNAFTGPERILKGNLLQVSWYHTIRLMKERIVSLINK